MSHDGMQHMTDWDFAMLWGREVEWWKQGQSVPSQPEPAVVEEAYEERETNP